MRTVAKEPSEQQDRITDHGLRPASTMRISKQESSRNEAKQKGRLDALPNDEGDKLEARSSAAIRVAAALFSFGAFRVGIFAN